MSTREFQDKGKLTEGVVDANGPGHPLLSLNGREHLCGVLKGDWSLSQGITNGEQVDEPKGNR
jgi:hypothetical protein